MKKFPLVIGMCCVAISKLGAVILLDTGDPAVNTTAPAGPLLNSGWQYEGDWGGNLGTPVSPNFFISAAHVGQAGSGLVFQNVSYPTVGSFSLPGSDLLIWKIAGSFPQFAPLFTARDEVGQHLVVIGRGTRRGAERYLNGTLRGWDWAKDTEGTRRWGENDVTAIVPYQGHDLLAADFDQHIAPNDRPNEAHLSSGDSGGAIFLNVGGMWKFGGINSFVDDLYSAPTAGCDFTSAIFDARGFYTRDGSDPSMFVQISGPDPVPTAFYASRISSELAWICSVIADPHVGSEADRVTLTFWRLIASPNDIVYEVKQSPDLVSWSPATTQEEIVSTAGDLELVKVKVDPGTSDHLFLRLSVTRP
ncbi:MAG: hypothetical protein ACJ8M1_15270 [Chthoniobacterales bacterium]